MLAFRRAGAQSLAVLALAVLILSGASGCRTAAPVGRAAPAAAPEPARLLTILHTNDHHGHAWASSDGGCADVGGLAAQATLVRQVRAEVAAEGGAVLLLLAGDVNTGVPESDLCGAEADLEGLALIGYDALVCGNHEFDGGVERWERQLRTSRVPILCGNVRRRSDGEPLARTHLSLDVGGLRVGVVGVVTEEAASSALSEMWTEHYVLDDPVETAARLGEELRADHDVLVALTHLGIYTDPPERAAGAPGLADRTQVFDVIVDGHTHTLLREPLVVGRTRIVQAGAHGTYVGRLDLTVRGRVVEGARSALLPVNAAAPDDGACPAPSERVAPADDVAAVLAVYRDRVAAELAERVGVVAALLPGAAREARREETALGNLVADALRAAAEAEIALVNGGGLRASLGPGDVSWGDIRRVCPFPNLIVRLRLTGAQLQQALDRSARAHSDDGGFLQVSGLRYAIQGGRAVDVQVGDAPLDPAATYTVATVEFLADGAEGYEALRGAPRETLELTYGEALRRHIAALGTVQPVVEGRIRRL
jgi:5'-nucleotidase/UDP-sugar diphosphatase